MGLTDVYGVVGWFGSSMWWLELEMPISVWCLGGAGRFGLLRGFVVEPVLVCKMKDIQCCREKVLCVVVGLHGLLGVGLC